MKKIRFIFWPLLIFCLFLIFGLIIVYYLQQKVNKDFLEEISWTSDISLAAVNPDRVKNLSDILPADITATADFSRIKDQIFGLGDLFATKGIDSIYLLSEKEDKIYFIAESTHEGQPLYVTPGKLYKEAPPEAYNAFKSKTSFNSKVYSDEYGTYISRFAPVINKSGDLVGVLGVDVDYNYYQKTLAEDILIFFGIWLLITCLVILVFFYLRNIYKLKNESRISEEKIRAISDSLSDGVVVVDETARITFCNQESEKIFGLELEKALGQKFSDLVKLEEITDINLGKEILNFEFSPKNNLVDRIFEFKFSLRKKGVKYYELSFTATEIEGKYFLIGVFHDISTRRLAAQELKTQKEELEKLNSLMVDRELKMMELKKEIAGLKIKKQ